MTFEIKTLLHKKESTAPDENMTNNRTILVCQIIFNNFDVKKTARYNCWLVNMFMKHSHNARKFTIQVIGNSFIVLMKGTGSGILASKTSEEKKTKKKHRLEYRNK